MCNQISNFSVEINAERFRWTSVLSVRCPEFFFDRWLDLFSLAAKVHLLGHKYIAYLWVVGIFNFYVYFQCYLFLSLFVGQN